MQSLVMLGFGAVLMVILVWFSNLLFRKRPFTDTHARTNTR